MTTATVATAATAVARRLAVPVQPSRADAADALRTPWSGARLPRPRQVPPGTGFPSLALIELARFGR